MISRIEPPFHAAEISPLLFVQKGEGYPLHSTVTTLAPISSAMSVLQIVLFPILWPLKKLYAKMAPTTEELELFEDLIAKALAAGKSFIDSRTKGEKELQKVIAFANSLYDLFTGKWLSWTEGIVFMRAHLVQITMRLYTLVGDDGGVEICQKRLEKVGYQPRGDIEAQLSYMRMMRKTAYRPFLKLGSVLAKLSKLIVG